MAPFTGSDVSRVTRCGSIGTRQFAQSSRAAAFNGCVLPVSDRIVAAGLPLHYPVIEGLPVNGGERPNRAAALAEENLSRSASEENSSRKAVISSPVGCRNG
jgi:hypothetical protein